MAILVITIDELQSRTNRCASCNQKIIFNIFMIRIELFLQFVCERLGFFHQLFFALSWDNVDNDATLKWLSSERQLVSHWNLVKARSIKTFMQHFDDFRNISLIILPCEAFSRSTEPYTFQIFHGCLLHLVLW